MVQQMSHALGLGFEVFLVELIATVLKRTAIGYDDAMTGDGVYFGGVIGHEDHMIKAHGAHHMPAYTVMSLIGFKAEL